MSGFATGAACLTFLAESRAAGIEQLSIIQDGDNTEAAPGGSAVPVFGMASLGAADSLIGGFPRLTPCRTGCC